MLEPNQWEGLRVRVQRLCDARFFGGWVLNVSDPDIALRIHESGDLGPGDRVMIQVFAVQSLFVQAECVTAASKSVSFELTSRPVSVPSSENARMSLTGALALMIVNKKGHRVELIDVGLKGLAVSHDRELLPKEQVLIETDTKDGRVRCLAEVRYSRPNPQRTGEYRIGMEIVSIDDESQTRWATFFRTAA